MNLKRLTRIALAALLFSAGTAALSAKQGGVGILSLNQHNGKSAEYQQKKNQTGFTARLMQSGRALGRSVATLFVPAGKPKAALARHRDRGAPAKVQFFASGRQVTKLVSWHTEYAYISDMAGNPKEAASGQSRWISLIETPAAIPVAATTGPPHSLYILIGDPCLNYVSLLTTHGSVRGTWVSNARGLMLWLREMIRPLRPGRNSSNVASRDTLTDQFGMHSLRNRAKYGVILPQMQLTIDLPSATRLLAHGAMGSGSALRSHRSRNDRS